MHVAIIGGGISGLATAFYTKRLRPGWDVSIFEKKTRLGGTMHTEDVDGFLFETGSNLPSQAPKAAIQSQTAGNLNEQHIVSGKTDNRRELLEPGRKTLQRLLLRNLIPWFNSERR